MSSTTLSYNAQKELLSVVHGGSAGATLVRNASTGYVTSRTLHHIDKTETFDLNAEGWIVIRGGIDRRVTLTGRVAVTHVGHVRIQGFHLACTNDVPAVLFADVEGPALASCVVLAPVAFTNSPGARAVGNTFDGTEAEGRLSLLECTGAVLRNNVFLNDGTDAGVTWDAAPDSDYNAFYPDNGFLPSEANSVYAALGLTADGTYRVVSSFSAVVAAGEPQRADSLSTRRTTGTPCVSTE